MTHIHAHPQGANQHVDLIDTTEMYLRTVYELEEEGVVPLRARIAERLGQSGPTVSQTVARMERDGLLSVADDRHLELSAEGRRHAISVMRKHRLAERLLLDIIGLEWDQVHIEACRWEHVMSDAVERRILALLDKPDGLLLCPHGNPIPGLEDLGLPFGTGPAPLPTLTLLAAASPPAVADGVGRDGANPTGPAAAIGRQVVIERISEHLQPDAELMRLLDGAGIRPGATVSVRPGPDSDGVVLGVGERCLEVDGRTAAHLFVTVAAAAG